MPEDATPIPPRISHDLTSAVGSLPNMPERLRPAFQRRSRPEDVLTADELAATEQPALDRQAYTEVMGMQREVANRAWFARMPPGYDTATLADLDRQQDPDGHIAQWLDGNEQTLLLVGQNGLGKSYAAYGVGNEAHRRGMYVVGWPMPELNRALRPGEDRQPGVLRQLQTCPLLVLDDLGGEKVTEWTLEQLYDIVRCRIGGRRTIVTTNLTHVETQERYGDRIMDRLLDDARVVRFAGSSRRRPRW